MASLKSMVEDLVETVWRLEGSICYCCNCLLLPAPHFAEGEGPVVEDSEGLEYKTDEEASGSSYITLIPASPPLSQVPTRSPTPEDSDLDKNGCLQTKLLE